MYSFNITHIQLIVCEIHYLFQNFAKTRKENTNIIKIRLIYNNHSLNKNMYIKQNREATQ